MSIPKAPAGCIIGVDVSRVQGKVDVPALQAEGCAFIYGQATDGENSVDPRWNELVKSCAAAKMPLGGYGVLEAYGLTRASGQAKHFSSVVKDSGAVLPSLLDFELGKGRTALDLLQSAVRWRDEVEDELSRGVLVYTYLAFIAQLEKLAGAAGKSVAAALARSPVAIADYTQDIGKLPPAPAPWLDWTLWQLSGGRAVSRNYATLPGTRTDVDVDLFRGSIEELIALGAVLV